MARKKTARKTTTKKTTHAAFNWPLVAIFAVLVVIFAVIWYANYNYSLSDETEAANICADYKGKIHKWTSKKVTSKKVNGVTRYYVGATVYTGAIRKVPILGNKCMTRTQMCECKDAYGTGCKKETTRSTGFGATIKGDVCIPWSVNPTKVPVPTVKQRTVGSGLGNSQCDQNRILQILSTDSAGKWVYARVEDGIKNKDSSGNATECFTKVDHCKKIGDTLPTVGQICVPY